MLKYLAFLAVFVATANAQCGADWTYFGDACYQLFSGDKMNWTDARVFCKEQFEGADLAIVNDPNVARDLYSYVQDYNLKGDFWLGGSDDTVNILSAEEGQWFWINKARVPRGSPYWAISPVLNPIGEPFVSEPDSGTKANCLCMESDRYLYWADAACSENYHPACSYTPSQ